MASSKGLTCMLLLTAPLLGAYGQAFASNPVPITAAQSCLLTPPAVDFQITMAQPPALPTAGILPSNPGAWSTLIVPGPEHRWDAKGGLVESLDGSLLLHGVASGPSIENSRLHVVVLADYEPLSKAVISGWDAERTERLGRVVDSRAMVDAVGAAIAFDIELPKLTVPIGTYREIQTLVWFDGGSIDARRWTVSAGAKPPAAVECVDANTVVSEMPTRTQLDPDGGFVVRSPRATTLAVVPLQSNGPGAVQFLRIDQVDRGWEGQLGSGVEMAAVWEGPFTGPGKSWISSFWSARRALTTER